MSSAVPIHPMLRLARRQAAANVSSSIANTSAARTADAIRRSTRSFASTSALQAPKRASAKAAGDISAAAGPSASSSSPQGATQGSYVPPAKEADAMSRAEGGGPLFSETFSKDSAAMRSYAASVRGKPRSPPPKIKLTDTRSEEQKKQSQKADPSTEATAVPSADASPVTNGKSKATTSAASTDREAPTSSVQSEPPPPAGAQKMLNGEAQPSASNAEQDTKRDNDISDRQSTPLAEGVIIHANAADRKLGDPTPGTSNDGASSTSSNAGSFSAAASASASSTMSRDSSSSSSSTSTGQVGGDGGPPVESASVSDVGVEPPAQLLHPFDTHNFVKRLQEAHFVRKRAMPSDPAEQESTALVPGHRHDPAEAIMGALRHLLVSHGDFILGSHINKTEMENQSYLFSAALAELRTELQVRARNDAAALRSMVTLLQREVDALNQRMREDVASMKHDIQVDMNNRKGEAKDEGNTLEQEIQDLNNRFTISISDLKTEIEQSLKWDATRRALTLFFGTIVIIIATLTAADYLTRDLEKDDGNATSKRDGNTGNARNAQGQSQQQQIIETRPRSAEELGVLPQYDDEQVGRLA